MCAMMCSHQPGLGTLARRAGHRAASTEAAIRMALLQMARRRHAVAALPSSLLLLPRAMIATTAASCLEQQHEDSQPQTLEAVYSRC